MGASVLEALPAHVCQQVPTLVMDLDMCGQGHDVCRTVEDWILHESYKNIYVFHLLLSGRWIIQ